MARAPMTNSPNRNPEEAIIHRVATRLKQPLRILHVDDTEGILFLQRLHLQRQSNIIADYVGVMDTETALQTIASWRPDLILSDIARPCMDGFTFTELLKARPDTQHIPVAFLTANGGQKDKDRAYAAGVSAFFVKPGFPHLPKIHQLAAQHRVDKVMETIPLHQQLIVGRGVLSSVELDSVMRSELQRRLSASV